MQVNQSAANRCSDALEFGDGFRCAQGLLSARGKMHDLRDLLFVDEDWTFNVAFQDSKDRIGFAQVDVLGHGHIPFGDCC